MPHSLFQLIKSMTAAEKRYFKLGAFRYKNTRQSIYLRIFDALDSMTGYDEARFMKKLGPAPFSGHLATLKNQLNTMILDSIAAQRNRQSTGMELRRQLGHIEVLYGKGLFEACSRIIEKAKRKATEAGCNNLLLEILEWERRIALKGISESPERGVQQFHRAAREAVAAISSSLGYRELADTMQEIRRRESRARTPETRAKLATLAKNKLLQNEDLAQTVHDRICLKETQGAIHWMTGDIRDALKSYGEAANLWEGHPAFAKNFLDDYKAALDRYLTCAAGARQWEIFNTTVQKLKALPAASIQTEIYLFGSVNYLELLHCLNTGMLTEGRSNAADIEQGLQLYDKQLKPNRLLTLLHNCCIVYFLSGCFERALEFLNRIQALEQGELKRDIQEFSRILRLILHYELRDFSALEHMFRSTYRWLRKRETPGEFERCVLGAMRALLNCPDAECRQSVFADLRHSLLQLLRSGAQSKYVGIPEILFWSESRLLGEEIEGLYSRRIQALGDRELSELFEDTPRVAEK